MHALVTRLRFKTEDGPDMEAAEARKQADEMEAQRGFRAFVVVRIGPTEAMFIRVYDTREDLAAGFSQGFAPHLGEQFSAKPERVEGEVLVSRWVEHPDR
jgi:heme-degrading monooxygenase HmoA